MSHRSASGDEASAGFDDLGSADLWWQLLQARGLKDLWWPLLMGVWLHLALMPVSSKSIIGHELVSLKVASLTDMIVASHRAKEVMSGLSL